ncbi:alkaline shock response membrane anchor protein AmaP [Paenibacillus sp. GCM10027626]|uniref:alkaline shock response membrane anchor protein AmaP n=1 Tax=Paenibacillus sp. GCM10027626 TaxID=3273411 RepID=UPI003636E0F6
MIRMMDKLLLFVYSLAIGIAAVFVFCLGFNWVPEQWVENFSYNVYSGANWLKITLIAVSAALFLISLRFFYVSVRRSNVAVPSIDQRTEFGDIRISMETVENLALKVAGRQREVKDLRARIRLTDAGIDIALRAVVDGETSIPALTEEIQKSVKDHVEEITGIPVAIVSVYVANIIQTTSFKSRVE